MPRNAAGVYSLPPTNPVVPQTTIATNWANPTMSDIATALTESLDRAGRGGMTAPFRVADGIVSAPGIAFTNETNLGMWRSAAGVANLVANGANYLTIGPDRAASPVHFEVRGFMSIRESGQYNWKIYDNVGAWTILPSTVVNGEVWNTAVASSIAPTTGIWTVPGLVVTGTFAAGTFNPVAIVTGTIDATGAINSNTSLNAPVFNANQYRITASSTAGVASVNFATSQSQIQTLAAPLTITSITGLTIGNIGRIIFKASNNAVTFPATVKWPGPTFAKPDFNAGTLKITIVVLEFDGTNFLANASVY